MSYLTKYNDALFIFSGWYFTFLDYIFLVIYFIECVLKIYVWRFDYFKEMWNIIGEHNLRDGLSIRDKTMKVDD